MNDFSRGKIIFYIILGIVIGYFGRGLLHQGYSDGWEAAKQALIQPGQEITEITSLTGQIKEINDDYLVLLVDALSPLDDEDFLLRKVKFDEGTKITLRQAISDEEYYGPEVSQQIKVLEDEMASLYPGDSRLEAVIEEIETLKEEAKQIKQEEVQTIMEQIAALSEEAVDEKDRLQQQILDIDSGYKLIDISPGQLQIGSLAKVTADKNIYDDKKFTAVKIEVK